MSKNTIMTFGKYKGSKLKEIPWQYLQWTLKNVKFKKEQSLIKSQLQEELQRKNIF